MQDFYDFAGAHPVLTVILACIASSTLIGIVTGFGRRGRR